MEHSLVRFCSVKLSHFKNTKAGLVEMPAAFSNSLFSEKADILGIYGQNGSGKTAVIEAMDFIKRLLTGQSLPDNAEEYIEKEHPDCSIEVTYALKTEDRKWKVTYKVTLARLEQTGSLISEESLVSCLYQEENKRFETKKTLFHFKSDDRNGQFSPDFRYKALVRANDDNKINLVVAKKLAQKERCSYLFGKESMQIFLTAPPEVTADYEEILRILHRYACDNLFVIKNKHSGGISLNLMLPFAFRLTMGSTIVKGDLPVRLDEPAAISEKHFHMVKQILNEMNTVLTNMIPGLSIGIYDFGERLLKDGTAGHKIELISRRGDVSIPLKYESEGIIKIISILNVLMCVYNDPSMCLMVDELDAGIYEYLLGELLVVFEKGAGGQLLFTSHNLRPLEMLHKSSIVFSTTNPENRYIRFQYVKTNHNLRELYLRSITLGGQKEEVYAETDTVEIGRAFRRAGKAVYDGGDE